MITVQLSCVISFSNETIQMTIPAVALPVFNIPNNRSGIILGQSGFINHMVVEAIPSKILELTGQKVEDDEWGFFNVSKYVNEDGLVVL